MMVLINSCEAKKLSDVLHALFNGYCPTDDSLLEKLRTWLEVSLNDAGTLSHLLSLNDKQTTWNRASRNVKAFKHAQNCESVDNPTLPSFNNKARSDTCTLSYHILCLAPCLHFKLQLANGSLYLSVTPKFYSKQPV